jgi:hypothetical protein
MEQSDSIKEIATALCKAQAEMKPAPKDATNPHFKSRYADLASIWEAVREPLTKHGLSVIQSVMHTDNGIAVQTQLNHQSGEWLRMDPCPIPVDKSTAQSAGSAITYGKRYSLSAAVGIVADDDDDANGAQPPRKPQPERKPEPAPPLAGSEMTTKDNKIIAQVVQMFAEVQSEADYTALMDLLKKPDSAPNKADHPDLVKKQIWLAIKNHQHEPKKQPEPDYEPVEA